MFDEIDAVRLIKKMESGRTCPCMMVCENRAEKEIEVVVKLSGSKEMTSRSLITEAIVAMMAADLDLPVPEPYCVRISQEFADAVCKFSGGDIISRSIGLNFGSKKLPPDFYVFSEGQSIPEFLFQKAVEILVFDRLIENADRRRKNSNVLFNGRDFAIIDHEMALTHDLLILVPCPWDDTRDIQQSFDHIFLDQVLRKKVDLSAFRERFNVIDEKRVNEYAASLPAQWVGDGRELTIILDYISKMMENIDVAIERLEGALK